MDHAMTVPEDLDSPHRELFVLMWSLICRSPFSFFGNYLFVCLPGVPSSCAVALYLLKYTGSR